MGSRKRRSPDIGADTVRAAFARRDSDEAVGGRYVPINPGHRFMIVRRDWTVIQLLDRAGMFPLGDKWILDVGCGDGGQLRKFVDVGADPRKCFGIDLSPHRLESARSRNAHMTFIEGTAEAIPLPDRTFDIVTQFVAFSSMPPQMQERCSREIRRLLKPEGSILWYDVRMLNPGNRDVMALSKRKIRRLFGPCTCEMESHTLAPPISRSLAPRSEILCLILEKIPLLRTHYIGIIRPVNRI